MAFITNRVVVKRYIIKKLCQVITVSLASYPSVIMEIVKDLSRAVRVISSTIFGFDVFS